MNHHFSKSLAGILCLSSFFFASCVKMGDAPAIANTDSEALQMQVPATFDYKTTQDVNLNISLLTNDNLPLAGVLVNVLDKSVEENGDILYTALTNAEGKVTGTIKLPTYLTQVVVDANYIGVLRNAKVKLASNQVLATIGGAAGYGGNVLAARKNETMVTLNSLEQRTNDITYKYMGNYNSSGKPSYMENKDDVISSKLLSYINASLPEGKAVPTYHPDYLKNTVETNINITETADVWITFVHEGAGYQNSLAYFTYTTGKAPEKLSDISALNIILPNASFNGSGGALSSGNKVKLGRFSANTSIGFCLIANGWNDNNRAVGTGYNKFFSIDALNPESSATLKRHSVLLKDSESGVYLIGIDDQRRDQESDNDFNDIIFYASANPPKGISDVNVAPVDKPGDTDKDGVTDVYDQFPTDPARAYINYYPSANSFTTVAFEDTWPNTGDYDLNDVVIDQRYKIINNASNNTVEIFAEYVTRASGGSFDNGFGVQFPFASSLVSAVTGTRVTGNTIVNLGTNGCESGQAKAVIFPFDNFHKIMPRTGNSYVNTDPASAFQKPDTIKMKVSFASPISASQLGTAPYNPFIICNKIRGNEAHLPGELPTDKANKFLFNTAKDNTVPSLNRYYKTAKNLPFGICIPQKFDYPIEGKSIALIYLKFVDWAQSGGTLYPDWYKETTGYRSLNYFYKP